MIAVLVATQVLALMLRQAAACVFVPIDGCLAEDAEERAIAALSQALRLIELGSRAVKTTVFALIDAH